MSIGSGPAHPPRLPEGVLRRLIPGADREALLEELRELYTIQCARRGVPGARWWYVRQVAAFAVQLARHGRKRGVREARSRFEAEMNRRQVEGGGVDVGKSITELAQAAKRLSRAPVFTAVAVLTIGIGIGAFTSIFSLVEGVLIEPMPYEDPDELAWVWRDYVSADFPRGWLGGPDIHGMMEQPDVFEGVVGFRTGSLNLAGTDGAAPAQVVVHYATPGLFDVLGVPLMLGRESRGDENLPEGPEVGVLTYELWRTHFGADPDIVGRSIVLNDVITQVIGVAPEHFRFVKHGSLSAPQAAGIYMPLRIDLSQDDGGGGSYAGLVRIRQGVHEDQLAASLSAAAEYTNSLLSGGSGSGIRLWAVGLKEDLVEGVRPALIALIGSAAFLLLILGANLATLLLSRAAAREHELGIRLALGAGRSRILSSVVAESAVLAVVGGAIGTVMAVFGTDLVVRLAPDDLPRLGAVAPDASVLGVALAVTLAMALMAALTPALFSLRASLTAVLKEGGFRSGGSVRGTRIRSALVAAQVALSLMLLVGAGLTAEAFSALLRQDPGFDPESTLTFRVPLPGAIYQGPDRLAFHSELKSRIESLPGVAAVGASTVLPLTELTTQRGISFPGAPGNVGDREEDSPLSDNFRVTPGYFEATGHRLVSGRGFSSADADSTVLNIVIDDVLADRFFPDGSAVGSIADFLGDTATIVGVVDQARLYSVHEDDRGQVYFSFERFPSSSVSYAVRTTVEPESMTPAIRSVLRELDPAVPMSGVRTMEDIVATSLGQQRLSLRLIMAFALSALLLAGLGIYGVVSAGVIRRTSEIGVRMALGASGDAVVRMVLGQGLRLAVVGAVVGLVGAIGTSRALEGVVVGLDPESPLVYLGVTIGLVAVASLASYLPARRATMIDPLEALRPE